MAKVFISYSHDTDEHQDRVFTLADNLERDGLDVIIDRDCGPGGPAEGWPLWSERQIQIADYVLVACTPIYRRRYDGDEDVGSGMGAACEARAIRQLIYDSSGVNDKFRVILFDEGNAQDIPLNLRSYHRFNLLDDEAYNNLLAWLRDEPSIFRNNSVGSSVDSGAVAGPLDKKDPAPNDAIQAEAVEGELQTWKWFSTSRLELVLTLVLTVSIWAATILRLLYQASPNTSIELAFLLDLALLALTFVAIFVVALTQRSISCVVQAAIVLVSFLLVFRYREFEKIYPLMGVVAGTLSLIIAATGLLAYKKRTRGPGKLIGANQPGRVNAGIAPQNRG